MFPGDCCHTEDHGIQVTKKMERVQTVVAQIDKMLSLDHWWCARSRSRVPTPRSFAEGVENEAMLLGGRQVRQLEQSETRDQDQRLGCSKSLSLNFLLVTRSGRLCKSARGRPEYRS